ncbi:MAG: cobalamin-dependent protein [Candidatus Omnitrophica bacterium]|nr:cobalamin-dependent protein [Candidatus Omnitrophota bacterium]
MKKVLLINPPRNHYSNSNQLVIGLPLGLMNLAKYLQRHSISVSILDCLVGSFEVQQKDNHVVQGMPFNELQRRVSLADPDIIGIAFPFSTQYDICVETVKIIKQVLPHVRIIAGGAHVTVAAEDLMRASSQIDICVIGEGERTLYELVDNYSSRNKNFTSLDKINGIVFRDAHGNLQRTKPRENIMDLDELGYPAYDLVDMEKYLHNEYSYGRPPGLESVNRINMITSRGCPFNCVFCSIHLSMGRKWRSQSAEHVVSHIEFLVKNFGVKYFHFEDDNLSCDVNRFDRIMDMIVEWGIKINWDNQNGMRADRWTYERLLKAKKSGCSLLNIAIESGNQEVLDLIIGKKLKLKDVLTTVKMAKKVGIPVFAFFVIGFPGETIAQMKQTLNFSIKLRILYNASSAVMVATPFLGTRLHKICVENGYITKPIDPQNIANATLDNTDSIIRTPLFGPEDIKLLSMWHSRQMSMARYARLLFNPKVAFRKTVNKCQHFLKGRDFV